MASKRKQNGPGPNITKYFRVTSSVKEPNTDTDDVESETNLLVVDKDRQSEPVSSTNNAPSSTCTSDNCAFSAGEYDEASDVLNNLG